MNPEHAGHTPRLYWASLSLTPPDEANVHLFAGHYSVRLCSAADLANDLVAEIRTAAGLCFECEHIEVPEMSLINEVKRRYPSVPVLLLTSHLTAEVATWALRSRVFDCLAKPLKDTEVAACIERLKAARMARREQNARSSIAPAPIPSTSGRPIGRDGSRMEWVQAEIRRRLPSRPSETEIAALCKLSPGRFSRLFRREAGVTFQQFLAQTRIERASRLLVDTGLTISEIGARVGYEDPAYFSRFFRRQTGLTPSEYRGRAQEQVAAAGKTAAA